MFTFLMIVIMFACLASLYTEGIWGNAIRLINVVTSALLATNFFEPVADWMEGMAPSYTYVVDFVALWGLFALFMIVFRLATDLLSRVKVRFLKIADQIGSIVLAFWIGWVMVCFTATSLHVAPLAHKPLWGSFQAENRMLFDTAPDRQWLAFTQKMSLGPYCRLTTIPGKNEKYVFDPDGLFMPT